METFREYSPTFGVRPKSFRKKCFVKQKCRKNEHRELVNILNTLLFEQMSSSFEQ